MRRGHPDRYQIKTTYHPNNVTMHEMRDRVTGVQMAIMSSVSDPVSQETAAAMFKLAYYGSSKDEIKPRLRIKLRRRRLEVDAVRTDEA